MSVFYFVTTNTYKFEQFKKIVGNTMEVEQLSLTTPEIQAEFCKDVAAYSALWAAENTGKVVFKEDVGLHIDYLSGFPGPFLSTIEKQIKDTGFIKLMQGADDRSAYWEYAISYCEPSKEPVTFSVNHPGSIANTPKGKSGWYADKIFIPDGQVRTIAELLDAYEYVRKNEHYEQLLTYLKKR